MPTDTGLIWTQRASGAGQGVKIGNTWHSAVWPCPGVAGSSLIRMIASIRLLHVPPSLPFVTVEQFAPVVVGLGFQTTGELSGPALDIDDFDQDWLWMEPIAWQDYVTADPEIAIWQVGTFAEGLLDTKTPRVLPEDNMWLTLLVGEKSDSQVVGPFRDNMDIACTLRILHRQ